MLHPGYRGRIAPSPTGYFHTGHARTFWTAYQRALQNGGTLVFRNEDLDCDRCKPEFVAAMFEDLAWLGIKWQEGPDVGGPFGSYNQSERGAHYLNCWQRLRDGGFIYACTCSRKDLAEMASAPHHDDGDAPTDPNDELIYPGKCRPGKCRPSQPVLPSADSRAGSNWRFRVPDGEVIHFVDRNVDQNFGAQRFIAGKDFGDFLVWRKDDVPSYQLACIVDDAAMNISEVVRGADLLRSTARQLLLFRALGLAAPEYLHCALVTDDRGQRLAKRHDALSLRTLRQRGVSPAEIIKGF